MGEGIQAWKAVEEVQAACKRSRVILPLPHPIKDFLVAENALGQIVAIYLWA